MENATETDVENEGRFATWAIVEIMGHRRLIGYLAEQEIGGTAMLRIDVLADPPVTQIYSATAVFCITPVTEDTARRAATLNRVAPVSPWELPAPPAPRPGPRDYLDGREDDDEDEPGLTGPAF